MLTKRVAGARQRTAPTDALPKIKLPDGFEQKLMFENALGFYRLPEMGQPATGA